LKAEDKCVQDMPLYRVARSSRNALAVLLCRRTKDGHAVSLLFGHRSKYIVGWWMLQPAARLHKRRVVSVDG